MSNADEIREIAERLLTDASADVGELITREAARRWRAEHADEIEAYWREWEQEVLHGTGKGEPRGIFSVKP